MVVLGVEPGSSYCATVGRWATHLNVGTKVEHWYTTKIVKKNLRNL